MGTARTYGFQTIQGVVKGTGVSQPGGSGCSAASSSITYDANGNVTSHDDFNGNRTHSWYDLARNLETTRSEGLAVVNGSEQVKPETRTRTTTWHSTLRLPSEERLYTGGASSTGVPTGTLVRITTYAYDNAGNLTNRSIKDPGTGTTRTTRTWSTSYTYHAIIPGVLVQKVENGPRTDVADLTTTDYYAPDENCLGSHFGCRGQVRQITNALGHVTHITRYNAHGQPEEIIDPNGLVTTLAYDVRQRLLSRTEGTATTLYEYDPAGQLLKLTRPDGSFLAYTYDAAHRLTQVADNLGNRIAYTLDLMGNRTREDVFDPENALAQSRQREFDVLNRLEKDIGAQSQTNRYEYDAQGNLKRHINPLLHVTGNSHDALNRLIQINDPIGGQTRQTLDALDRAVRVTDPKGVITTFTYNGLGDLTREVSADRGMITYTYDSAGNLRTRANAQGTQTYAYDALNRPIQYGSTTWIYDAGRNGIGRLTSMTDESGNTNYTYDLQGRLLGKTQSYRNGASRFTHTLGYAYDLAGRLIRQTYPSGAQLTTTYGGDGRPVEIKINGKVLISNIVYQPFGAPNGWTWGNGSHYSRKFDGDGRLTQYPFGSDTRSLVRDAADNITNTHHTNTGLNRSYSYDAFDRLIGEVDNIGATLWHYDLNSNRTRVQPGSSAYDYLYQPSSNRLTHVAGPVRKTYSYDGAGNPISDGLAVFTYNAGGRLTYFRRNGQSNQYLYNRLGERVFKSGAHLTNGPYYFLYDDQGHLIGEYDKNNLPRQETVWLEDTPIAVLKPGQVIVSSQVHYIHADHLNTPRAILDVQDRVVWQWHSDAFGQGLPLEDPDGDGKKFEYNLRFPGQYYDRESGLHYNYFRDYDPMTGRYLQFDPIGLEGGVNPYSYVGGNPNGWTDPYGLDKTVWNPGPGRSILDGPRNGSWGGKKWSGGVNPGLNGGLNGSAPPSDSGDMCYMKHDICYSGCKGLDTRQTTIKNLREPRCRSQCDINLVNDLKGLNNNSKQWPFPPRPGTESDSEGFRRNALDHFR